MKWPDFIYTEGEHELHVRGEMMLGDTDFVIYASSLDNWLPPHHAEEIDQQKREEILSRLDRFLSSQGIKYEIQ